MAGRILEFTADKSYEAGWKVGYEIGWKTGFEAGFKAGEEKLIKELQEIIDGFKLEEDTSTILRLISDKKFREEMYEEYKKNELRALDQI